MHANFMRLRWAVSVFAFGWAAHFLTANLGAQMILARYDFEGGWGPASTASGIDAAEWTTTANRIDYVTTKTALLGMTRAVALEVARTNITCNAICPGTVLTPAIEGRLRNEMQRDGSSWEDAEESFLSIRQPSRRFVKDENVAGLIAFLCGPHSGDINGAALPIDGAWLTSR